MNKVLARFTKNKENNIESLLLESAFMLDAENSRDIYVFRRLVEGAMGLGLWNGFVGQS